MCFFLYWNHSIYLCYYYAITWDWCAVNDISQQNGHFNRTGHPIIPRYRRSHRRKKAINCVKKQKTFKDWIRNSLLHANKNGRGEWKKINDNYCKLNKMLDAIALYCDAGLFSPVFYWRATFPLTHYTNGLSLPLFDTDASLYALLNSLQKENII